MGKALLLLVLSASLGGSVLVSQQHHNAVARADRARLQEAHRLAHDVARSGYAVGSQRLDRRFAPFVQRDVVYGGGRYSLQASLLADGRMALWSGGTAGGARYDVRGAYARLAAPCALLGAAFLHAAPDTSQLVLAGAGVRIRGADTRPPSRTGGAVERDGPGYTVAGLLADSLGAETFAAALAGLGGAGGTLGRVADEGYLRRLVGCLLTVAAGALETPDHLFTGNHAFDGEAFGSPAAPVVAVVEGDAAFTGTTRGYGLLVVGGDLLAGGDFVWEGLVMALGEDAAAVHLEDAARIYGGLVGGGLPGGAGGGGLLALGTLLEGALGGDGGVLGDLGAFRRPLHVSRDGAAGLYHSEEALGQLHALLPGSAGTARTVLLDEQFGIAAAP
jgi:hypothetical protein